MDDGLSKIVINGYGSLTMTLIWSKTSYEIHREMIVKCSYYDIRSMIWVRNECESEKSINSPITQIFFYYLTNSITSMTRNGKKVKNLYLNPIIV